MLGHVAGSLANSSKSTPSTAVTAATRLDLSPAVLPSTWEAASNLKGIFTPVALAGPGEGTACGGLDIRSATKFSFPST